MLMCSKCLSDFVQRPLPLSNQTRNWTLDKIGIPNFQVPINTSIFYIYDGTEMSKWSAVLRIVTVNDRTTSKMTYYCEDV